MHRREFLRQAGSSALSGIAFSGGLEGCLRRNHNIALRPGMLPVNLPETSCQLPPVHVSASRMIRTVVGLRPFRPSGFRVDRQQIGQTTVVHNYGHGGGGITLSWGTSKLAIDLGLPGHVGPVAVLGSGAVGLSTARLVQEAGYPVTLYTKALPPQTTSNIAGGQWFPASVYDPDQPLTPEFTEQFVAAARYAYRRYQIMTGPHYGIRWMRNYLIANQPWSRPLDAGLYGLLHDLLPEIQNLPAGQHPFGKKFVRQFDGFIVEPPLYLPAMLADVRLSGAQIHVRELRSVNDVQALPERLVFNCTGLGAKTLFGDEQLTPIRGQLTFLVP